MKLRFSFSLSAVAFLFAFAPQSHAQTLQDAIEFVEARTSGRTGVPEVSPTQYNITTTIYGGTFKQEIKDSDYGSVPSYRSTPSRVTIKLRDIGEVIYDQRTPIMGRRMEAVWLGCKTSTKTFGAPSACVERVNSEGRSLETTGGRWIYCGTACASGVEKSLAEAFYLLIKKYNPAVKKPVKYE